MKRRVIVAVALILVFAIGGVSGYELLAGNGNTCSPPTVTTASRYQAQAIQFGGVTEYCLANPARWANGVAVASDGSVWFGEQALPGLGRLFSNGTVVEYQWPGSSPRTVSGFQTSIWGVTEWNGRVWGADLDGGRLVGVSPSTGSMTVVNASSAPEPYLFAQAPDGSLWFTSLTTKATLGRLGTDLAVSSYKVVGLGGGQEPIQLDFVNSSLGYMVALNPSSGTGQGGLYSFDPLAANGTVAVSRVGGNFSLFFPDGVSYSQGEVWVSQHGPSNVVRYDVSSGTWTVYPTSTVSYDTSTLPYFIASTDYGAVWFNEHYANRIAVLYPGQGTLTEYSEADPPVTSGSQIQEDLTVAAGSQGLWFTSTSGNYVGFVSAGQRPDFTLSVAGSSAVSVARGSSTTVGFSLEGSWSGSLKVQVSDSENGTSVPWKILVTPSAETIAAGSVGDSLSVSLGPSESLAPGTYTVGVTVGDGLEFQTAYVFLTVT